MQTLTTRSLSALFVCTLALILAACGSDDDPQGFDGGLLGTLSCDDFGDCGTGEVSIFQHTDPGITDPAGLEPVYPQTDKGLGT